jgi:trehalose/maltose hydrolase-like predicted phosphorylase
VAEPATSRAPSDVPDFARRFEAVVLGWRAAGAGAFAARAGPLIDALCGHGVDVAFVTPEPVAAVDAGLGLRPPGPGRLLVAREPGAELVEIGVHGIERVSPGAAAPEGPAGDAAARVLDALLSDGIPPDLVLHAPALVGDDAARILEEQLRRRAEVPRVEPRAGWALAVDGIDTATERRWSTLLALGSGVVGSRGAPLLAHVTARPGLFASGAYDGDGPETHLLEGPLWDRVAGKVPAPARVRRVLDLYGAVLAETVDDGRRLRSARFVSLARPGIAALRLHAAPPVGATRPLLAPEGVNVAAAAAAGDVHVLATRGTHGAITGAAREHRRDGDLERVAAFVTGPAPDADGAMQLLAEANGAGFDALLSEHRRAWARRWAHADVVVEGDGDLQLATRVALFHLMSAVADRGEAAVGARGLSGRAYRGHVFWDADVFVLPFLAATHPPAARAMLEYRVRRLPQALAIARAEGRRGARFPWESAATGDDVTPGHGRDQTGRVVAIHTRSQEVHIVGDVAWAACCYADWTADEEFVQGPLRELLVQTARYWAARTQLDGDGLAHIEGVIGPDEYHETVDDNAFTNVLARWNLRRAAQAADRDPSVPAAERDHWREIADALVDGYDPATGVYEQFEGFGALEPLRIADIAPRRPIAADLLLGSERVRGAQVCKQADVLMLHHMLPDEVMAGSLEPNLDFYEPRTAHGSSLSPGIHASLFARAGRTAAALDALRLAARIDLDDLTGSTAGGVHLATMGSVWQALVFGFAGLRPAGGALALDPRLPPEWNALETRVTFRGTRLRIRVGRATVAIDADSPVTLALRDRKVQCTAGLTTIDYDAAAPLDREDT